MRVHHYVPHRPLAFLRRWTPSMLSLALGEGERVLALESREGTRASRRVEEGLSRSLSGGGGEGTTEVPGTTSSEHLLPF